MNTSSTNRSFGIAPPGYSLPSTTRLGRVQVQVSNLDRSIQYYRDVLGFTVLKSRAGTASLGARAADAAPLVELVERRGARPIGRDTRLGLYHFAILLPDRPALGRFLHHLLTQPSPQLQFGSADHLVSESIYLWDPDGLGIEVYADRPRNMWQVRGRELAMAVEPLDVRAVVESGGRQPWTGMPERTVMGHMHLSVGDLASARDFYHAALGFDIVVWSYPGALFLSAGGYHHHLGTNTWAAGAGPASDNDAKLLEWELVLPQSRDVDAAVASVGSAGYNITPDGIATDPWGTHVRLAGSKPDSNPDTAYT